MDGTSPDKKNSPPPPPPGSAIPAPGSAVPIPGKAVPAPGAAIPTPGSAIPAPGAAVPVPGAAVPTPGSAIPAPGAAIPTPGSAIPAPGAAISVPSAPVSPPGSVAPAPGVAAPSPGAAAPSTAATAVPVQAQTQPTEEDEKPRERSVRIRLLTPLTRIQWLSTAGLIFIGALVVMAVAVVAARWMVGLDAVENFIAKYPGEYALPESAPTGFPAWMGWQHFLNIFFLFLIIRTGIQVGTERKPQGYWTPKSGGKKISLTLWIHLILDLLWVLNGAIFFILLFATGQWMRLVPTSWEVFPNAISAGLQYLSLDWPTHNSWVNYNSLQELAYFLTVFIAAPLAILTGLRLSQSWPKNNRVLNRGFPIGLARSLHYPVMLYFVVFTIIHVLLVFATGALRNLNHMYAAQDATNWTGFWVFVVSMIVVAVAFIALRPSLVAPLAQKFGDVTAR